MGEPKQCSTVGNELPELPDHVKEEILAWMPLKSLCRFLSVSKQWNTLLSSTKFITTKWAEAPPNREPWLVLYDFDSIKPPVAYCFYTQCWQKTSCISISFMRDKYAISGRVHDYSFEGSAAGLFLLVLLQFASIGATFSIGSIGSQVCTVCNPLTRTFIELPPKLSIRRTLATCFVVGEGNSRETYKVVVVGHRPVLGEKGNIVEWEKRNIVEIYDSSEKSWSIAEHLLQDVLITNKKMVFCDGSFYCNAVRSEDTGITAFNLRDGTEIFALLPKIANGKCMLNPALLSYRSRFLVAGSTVKEGEKLLHEVIIWEFEKLKLGDSSSSSVDSSSSSSLWKEIAKMPPSMLNHLKRHLPPFEIKFFPFKCIAVRDHVCFIYRVRNEMDVIVYNLNENSWTWLPSCPLDYYSSFSTVISVTAFEPRLNMEVG